MKQIHIGTYPLYHSNIELFVWPDERGGRMRTRPPKGSPTIHIGLDYKDWEDVVSILLHESFEFCATFMELQYNPSNAMIYDSSAHLFVFDHAQFTRVCEFQASLITRCLPDLADAYKKRSKK